MARDCNIFYIDAMIRAMSYLRGYWSQLFFSVCHKDYNTNSVNFGWSIKLAPECLNFKTTQSSKNNNKNCIRFSRVFDYNQGRLLTIFGVYFHATCRIVLHKGTLNYSCIMWTLTRNQRSVIIIWVSYLGLRGVTEVIKKYEVSSKCFELVK